MFRIILCFVCMTAVFQFSGCFVQTSEKVKSETLPVADLSVSPTPEQSSKSFPNEYFEKEWKGKYDATVAELERNRSLWQENKIVNYDFVVARYAGGVTNDWNRLPVLIKIRQGEKISIEKFEKDKDYVISSRTDGFEDFDTIDKLFDYLRRQLDEGKIIDAEYDKKLGYPGKTISISDSLEIHGWRNIAVEKFEIIK